MRSSGNLPSSSRTCLSWQLTERFRTGDAPVCHKVQVDLPSHPRSRDATEIGHSPQTISPICKTPIRTSVQPHAHARSHGAVGSRLWPVHSRSATCHMHVATLRLAHPVPLRVLILSSMVAIAACSPSPRAAHTRVHTHLPYPIPSQQTLRRRVSRTTSCLRRLCSRRLCSRRRPARGRAHDRS